MRKFFLTFLILLNLLKISFQFPTKVRSFRVFYPDDDEVDDGRPFNDIIDPEAILKSKIDIKNYKKALRNQPELLENRFSDTLNVNDSASDFKPIFKLTKDIEDQISTTRIVSDDFDESAELRHQDGKYFQGDMMLVREQENFYLNTSENMELPSRTGVIDSKFRWRDVDGYPTIFYRFFGKSRYNKQEKKMIRLAMDEIESQTCIRFVPRSREIDFILIYSGDECSSFIGRTGGQQLVSLKKDACFAPGIIIHELVHTIGYDHMHNHFNRDFYIKILWENIKSEDRYNFDKVDPRKFSNFNTEYDYFSIMHYDPLAFSDNGKRTILPTDESARNVIGQRYGLSKGDVERINNMYEC